MSKQTTIIDDQFVAFRVRYEMGRQGKSMRELARVLDMTPPACHRRFRGRVPFSAVELARVAEFLEIEIAVFFPAPVGCAA